LPETDRGVGRGRETGRKDEGVGEREREREKEKANFT
jgi:hypothetical protein